MESHKIALLAGVSMFVGGTAAEAAVITQEHSFNLPISVGASGAEPSVGDSINDLTFFNGFNVADGTLDSVTITLDSFFDIFVSIDALTGNSNVADANAGFNFTYTAETFNFAFAPPGLFVSCTVNGEETAECTDNDSSSDDLDDTVTFTAADAAVFPVFLGGGSFGMIFDNAVELLQLTEGSASATSNANGTWQGKLTVEYTFTPSESGGPSIPEPATIALLGLGALALGAVARRRRD